VLTQRWGRVSDASDSQDGVRRAGSAGHPGDPGAGTYFGSFVFGKPGFPLSDVPLQAIAADVEAGRYRAKPSRVFRFEDIQEAHRVMESNEAKGKMVVVL
jgi:NADPH:quinone reductase-like Zn-dependent oxidoreductase